MKRCRCRLSRKNEPFSFAPHSVEQTVGDFTPLNLHFNEVRTYSLYQYSAVYSSTAASILASCGMRWGKTDTSREIVISYLRDERLQSLLFPDGLILSMLYFIFRTFTLRAP